MAGGDTKGGKAAGQAAGNGMSRLGLLRRRFARGPCWLLLLLARLVIASLRSAAIGIRIDEARSSRLLLDGDGLFGLASLEGRIDVGLRHEIRFAV